MCECNARFLNGHKNNVDAGNTFFNIEGNIIEILSNLQTIREKYSD